MDLRKAASHPMLFRKLFTDDILSGITKQLLKEPDFQEAGRTIRDRQGGHVGDDRC